MSILTRAGKGSALTWAEVDNNFLELDKISEYNNLAAFPVTGQANKYYLAKDSNKFYRWSGSAYVQINKGLELGETSTTAGRGDLTKQAYDHISNTNNPHAVTASQVGLGLVDNTPDLEKPISTATQEALSFKANIDALANKADLVGGKVPSSQLPSYVDDIVEVANFSALPVIGEEGKIYLTLDENKQYRWSGSVYVELTGSSGTTDSVPEGSLNKYFTEGRVLSSVLTGFVSGSDNIPVVDTDTVLQGLQKLSSSVENINTELSNIVIPDLSNYVDKTTDQLDIAGNKTFIGQIFNISSTNEVDPSNKKYGTFNFHNNGYNFQISKKNELDQNLGYSYHQAMSHSLSFGVKESGDEPDERSISIDLNTITIRGNESQIILDNTGILFYSNGLTFDILSGVGTRMVTADANGLLGTASIPSGGVIGTLQSVTDGTGNENKTSNSIFITGSTNYSNADGMVLQYSAAVGNSSSTIYNQSGGLGVNAHLILGEATTSLNLGGRHIEIIAAETPSEAAVNINGRLKINPPLNSNEAVTLGRLNSDLNSYQPLSAKNQVDGYVGLDSIGGVTLQKSDVISQTTIVNLENPTTAVLGVFQKSPSLKLSQKVWQTLSSGSSKKVDWLIDTLDKQTTTASSELTFSRQVESGSIIPMIRFDGVGLKIQEPGQSGDTRFMKLRSPSNSTGGDVLLPKTASNLATLDLTETFTASKTFSNASINFTSGSSGNSTVTEAGLFVNSVGGVDVNTTYGFDGLRFTKASNTKIQTLKFDDVNMPVGELTLTLPIKSGTLAVVSDIYTEVTGQLVHYISNANDLYTSVPKYQQAITLTAAEYAGISTPDANTIYYIV